MSFSEVFKPMMWYIITLLGFFFILPLAGYLIPAEMAEAIASGVEMPEGATAASVASSFVYYMSFDFVNPLAVGVCSVIYTLKNGFKWYFPIIAAMLFLPMMLVYFQLAGWYCIEYLGMSYCACGFAWVINRIRERNI